MRNVAISPGSSFSNLNQQAIGSPFVSRPALFAQPCHLVLNAALGVRWPEAPDTSPVLPQAVIMACL